VAPMWDQRSLTNRVPEVSSGMTFLRIVTPF
jgi:hypothetical protein